jgi:four helix bundle protein
MPKKARKVRPRQTKADYIAKMSISSKEARESAWWLRLGVAVGVIRAEEVQWEQREANELRFMIKAAIRKARASDDRGWVNL